MERSHNNGPRLNRRRGILKSQTRSNSQIQRNLQTSFQSATVLYAMKMTSTYNIALPLQSTARNNPDMPRQSLNQNRNSHVDHMTKEGDHDGHYHRYSYNPNPRPERATSPFSFTKKPLNNSSQVPYCPRQPYHYEESDAQFGFLDDEVDVVPPPPPRYQYRVNQRYGPPPSYYPPPPTSHRYGSYALPSPPVRRELSAYSDHRPIYIRKPPLGRSSSNPRQARSPSDLQDLDITCGRGAPTNYHYGNQVFMEVVKEYQTSYLCAKRSDKPHIAMKIMDLVKSGGARFVKREKTAGRFCWTEIEKKGAYEKVCQALRDGAPDLQRKVLSASKMKEQSKKTPKKHEQNDENLKA